VSERRLLPKTVAKRKAQARARIWHDAMRDVVRDLEADQAKTAAAALDCIAIRLYQWMQT